MKEAQQQKASFKQKAKLWKRKLERFMHFVFLICEILTFFLALFASLLITTYFLYQDFTLFIIQAAGFGIAYIGHLGILIWQRELVDYYLTAKKKSPQKQEDPQKQKEIAQPPQDGGLIPEQPPQIPEIPQLGCLARTKLFFLSCIGADDSEHSTCYKWIIRLLFVPIALTMLDIPLWFFKIKISKIVEYNYLLGLSVGLFSLTIFTPQIYMATIWLLSAKKFPIIFDISSEDQQIYLLITILLVVSGNTVGFFQISFFRKTYTYLDALFWGFIRECEMISKPLLIGLVLRHDDWNQPTLIMLAIFYSTYVIFCTLIYTQRQKDVSVFKVYAQSFALNLYARVLYFPYKESPCLMESLTAYHSQTVDKKIKQVPIAPSWYLDIFQFSIFTTKLQGFTRRQYTHSVQVLRFVENFNLIIFMLSLAVQNEKLLQTIESKDFKPIHLAQPASFLMTVAMLAYYIASGVRTVHYTKNDQISIDE
ncbi:hypothetical protein pb186bvf_019266 [Paramecium bursaria]